MLQKLIFELLYKISAYVLFGPIVTLTNSVNLDVDLAILFMWNTQKHYDWSNSPPELEYPHTDNPETAKTSYL